MGSALTQAFNVERVRSQMLKDIALPKDFFQKAINKTYEKLEAKKTVFFPFQGNVVETRDVEDHGTQLAAAEKIFNIAGVYIRERDGAPHVPQVALEVDSKTGIVRLIIGVGEVTHATLLPADLSTDDVNVQLELPPALNNLPMSDTSLSDSVEMVTVQEEDSPKVIKVKRGNLPTDVYNALFGELDGNGSH